MNSLSGAKAAEQAKFWLCHKCQRALRRPFEPHGAIRPHEIHRAAERGMTAEEPRSQRRQRSKLASKALRSLTKREGFTAVARLYITTQHTAEPSAECQDCLKARAEKFGIFYILTA